MHRLLLGQDITKEVMKGLTDELDAAKKAIEDSFSNIMQGPTCRKHGIS
jgi:hypothetical protein